MHEYGVADGSQDDGDDNVALALHRAALLQFGCL